MWSVVSRRLAVDKQDKKVRCPFCGYEMPLTCRQDAVCMGVFIRCKGRRCKKIFEIKIEAK